MHRVTRGSFGLLLLAHLAVGGPLQAQMAPAPEAGALTNLVDGAPRVRVRIGERWATLEQAQLQRDTLRFAEGITLDHAGRTVPVKSPLALGEVTEIRVPAGKRTGTGAGIGAGIGAALGFAAALAATSEPDCLGCPSDAAGFLAVPLVSAMGAGIGALIGSLTTRWQTVYQAP